MVDATDGCFPQLACIDIVGIPFNHSWQMLPLATLPQATHRRLNACRAHHELCHMAPPLHMQPHPLLQALRSWLHSGLHLVAVDVLAPLIVLVLLFLDNFLLLGFRFTPGLQGVACAHQPTSRVTLCMPCSSDRSAASPSSTSKCNRVLMCPRPTAPTATLKVVGAPRLAREARVFGHEVQQARPEELPRTERSCSCGNCMPSLCTATTTNDATSTTAHC